MIEIDRRVNYSITYRGVGPPVVELPPVEELLARVPRQLAFLLLPRELLSEAAQVAAVLIQEAVLQLHIFRARHCSTAPFGFNNPMLAPPLLSTPMRMDETVRTQFGPDYTSFLGAARADKPRNLYLIPFVLH